MVCNLDDCAHPWMNAALEAALADGSIGTSRSWTFFSATGGNENERANVQALGSRNRITRNAVKGRNESATKISDASKCMYLAANVLDQCRASNIEVHLAWLVSPLMNILRCGEFCNELVKRGMAVNDARAVAKDGIETRWLAIV